MLSSVSPSSGPRDVATPITIYGRGLGVHAAEQGPMPSLCRLAGLPLAQAARAAGGDAARAAASVLGLLLFYAPRHPRLASSPAAVAPPKGVTGAPPNGFTLGAASDTSAASAISRASLSAAEHPLPQRARR